MQNPKNVEYIEKYYGLKSEINNINYLEKKVKRVRTHVNPYAFLDEHQFDGFENQKDLVVDIGCAKGDFIERLNGVLDCNFIGFEVRPMLIKFLEAKYKEVPNVIFFSGNAEKNLKNVIEPSLKKGIKIKYIFINFPDPWIKNKHIKRRIVKTSFLNEIYDLLKLYPQCSDTQLIIQTDVDYMHLDILEQVKLSKWQFEEFSEPLHGISSNWELKSIKEGKTIYRIKAHIK